MTRLAFVGAIAGLALLAGPLSAAPYPGVSAITARDFTGTLEINVGGATVEATLVQGAQSHPVEVRSENGVLFITGEKRPWRYNLSHEIRRLGGGEKAFERYLADYPVLKITAPAGTDLMLDEAIARVSAGDLNSHVRIGGPWVEARIGDVKSADVGIGGPGDTVLGNVAETAHVAIGGSGDFSARDVGRAALTIGGSGNISLGSVKEEARMEIGGSGDISVKTVGGQARVSIGGSGDVRIDEAASGARLETARSGDTTIGRINGPPTAEIAGSGDIDIAEGRAENVKIKIVGSGDFNFGGLASGLDVSSFGSGSVSVARHEGGLTISGGRSGDITIGGQRISRDD